MRRVFLSIGSIGFDLLKSLLLMAPLGIFLVMLFLMAKSSVSVAVFEATLDRLICFIAGGVAYATLTPRISRWWKSLG